LQALIDALNTPALPNAEIVLVLSNRKAAYGLQRAQTATPPIPTAYLALQPYLKSNPGKTREDYDAEVAKIVLKEEPDMVVLAGWMHILSERFLEYLDGRAPVVADDGREKKYSIPVINLHPALPGAFDGAHAIERAYEAFQRGEIDHSGCMVHKVVKDVDRGEPVVVREVSIEKGESIETFEERLHKIEHEIIVEASKKVLDEVRRVQVGFSCWLKEKGSHLRRLNTLRNTNGTSVTYVQFSSPLSIDLLIRESEIKLFSVLLRVLTIRRVL
jgi:phosphoribosylglycinamide formyltransferase